MSTLCRHFGTCGGCTFQDVPPSEYRHLKREMVRSALVRHGFHHIGIEFPAEVPPAARRRASLAAAKKSKDVILGFRAARSHRIVDMHECRVLAAPLVELIPALRELMGRLLPDGAEAVLALTECQSGIDIALDSKCNIGARAVSELAQWARQFRVARVSFNGETVLQFAPATVKISGVEIDLPSGAFLQPSIEGEGWLQDFVRSSTKGAKYTADLFAGCGTFAFVLATSSQVHAVDSNEAALAALVSAARKKPKLKPVTVEVRDLAKRPLQPRELDVFDAVVLDPPRAGALAQAKALAASRIPRIAYVSCNPDSFGRDARILADAEYRLETVVPIDQFLWSSHIELAALFGRH